MLYQASFFSQDDRELAAALLDEQNPKRRLGIVLRFFEAIGRDEQRRPRTPARESSNRNEWLGSQWHAMSQAVRSIYDLPPQVVDDHPRSSPKVRLGSWEESWGHGMVRPLDFSRKPPSQTPSLSSEGSDEDREFQQAVNELAFDSPSRTATIGPAHPADETGDVEMADVETADAQTVDEETVDEQTVDEPESAALAAPESTPEPAKRSQAKSQDSGRTPYEVQTSAFFGKFISGFIDQVFPHPLGIYLALEERPYRFGVNTSRDHAKGSALFTSCPDGVFLRKDGTFETVFALIELKPFRRSADQRLIGMEETAEMTAYLSEDGAQRRPHTFVNRGDSGQYHQLIVSFDRDEFWFVLANFKRQYLDYIKDPAGQPVFPSEALTEDDMIVFQRIGPYRVRETESMRLFGHAFLAILLAQVKLPHGGKDIYDMVRG